MVRFDTLASRTIEYGKNDFVEVARKCARDEGQPDEPGVEYIMLSRGYYGPKGQRRFKMHLTLPPNEQMLGDVMDALATILDA